MGRCYSCGFLAKYSLLLPSLGKFEVSWPERDGAEFFSHNPTIEPHTKRPIPTVPMCAKGIIHFGLLTQNVDATALHSKLKELLAENRQCKGWREYVTTVGPQEMLDRESILQLEQERREFEVALHHDSQTTQNEMRRIAGSQLRWSIVAIVIGVVVTFLATFFTIRCSTAQVTLRGPLPVIVQDTTATVMPSPSPSVVAWTPTPSPESTPDTASSPTQVAP